MAEKIKKPIKIKYNKISKSKGKNFCDELWSILVKIRDGNQCVICGEKEYVNSHHLISRRLYNLRFLCDNGISLCSLHHEYCLICSAHTSPWGLESWMKNNRPEQYARWVERRNNITSGENNNYDQIYFTLEQEHKTATGNFLRIERIAPYILFLNYEAINNILLQDPSLSDNKKIALILEKMKDYNIGQTSVKDFLKKNKFIK